MRKNKGFTLIELMVVVAIVGIIAAIALPSYTEQVHKSRRADAIRAIGEIQLGLERWRAENPCYDAAGGSCGAFTASGTYPSLAAANTNSPYYLLAIPSATATGYQITAGPRSGSAQDGDRCGTYTFTMASGVLTKAASGGSNCSL